MFAIKYYLSRVFPQIWFPALKSNFRKVTSVAADAPPGWNTLGQSVCPSTGTCHVSFVLKLAHTQNTHTLTGERKITRTTIKP